MRTYVPSDAEALTSAIKRLEEQPGVDAVALFGSVARDEHTAESDIDVLLIGEPQLRPSKLRKKLNPTDVDRYSLTVRSWDRLDEMKRDGSLFFWHLRMEAKVVKDTNDRLSQMLLSPTPDIDVSSHIASIRRSMAMYDDLDRFGGHFLFCLSHFYVLGKRLAMLSCCNTVPLEFRPTNVFDRLSEQVPELVGTVDAVRSLRPFHVVVRGLRPKTELPFDFIGNSSEVARKRDAVKDLLRMFP